MKIHYITTTSDLVNFCTLKQNAKIIGIDTEFVRETTYYPQLCLIQIEAEGDIALIDPLKGSLNLDPLKELFLNPNILKLFHAPRQDLEIFYNIWKALPSPIFDTQLASQMCGNEDQISYADLVFNIKNIVLDKTLQYTAWDRRPLSQQHLTYAAQDVLYLKDIYFHFIEKIRTNPFPEKFSWLTQEMNDSVHPNHFEKNLSNAWKKIKINKFHSVLFWTNLQILSAFREDTAIYNNVPRRQIMKDETIIRVASEESITLSIIQELFQEITLGNSRLKFLASDDSLFSFFKNPSLNMGVPIKNCILNLESHDRPIFRDNMKKLKELLQTVSKTYQISSRIIASTKDLESFLWNPAKGPLTNSWRYEIFGKHALSLLV